MIESDLSCTRVIKLWSLTLFYSVSLTLVMGIINRGISMNDITHAFFPILRRTYWFSSAYIALLLLSPFLKRILGLERVILLKFLVLLTVLIVFFSTISKPMDNWLVYIIYFSYIYILFGYIKLYGIQEQLSKKTYLLLGILFYLATCCVLCFCSSTSNHLLQMCGKVTRQYLKDYKSFPNFAMSLLIFFGVTSFDGYYSRLVNTISRSSYGVYCFHQTPCFYPYLWAQILLSEKVVSLNNLFLTIVYVIGVGLTVYLFGSLIDIIGLKVIERYWMSSKIVQKANNMLNLFYLGL